MTTHSVAIIRLTCIAILAGSVMTITASWLVVFRVDLWDGATVERRHIHDIPREQTYRVATRSAAGFSGIMKRSVFVRTVVHEDPPAPLYLPYWVRNDLPWDAPLVVAEGYGWPWRAMCTGYFKSKNGIQIIAGLPFPERTRDAPWNERSPVILPVGIIPHGFIANTAFFSAAIFVLYLLATWCKRQLRRMSNRCPHCGYSLAGTTAGVCSECGTTVRSAEAT